MKFFNAIEVEENSNKFAWQLLQTNAVSGEIELHREQVCTGSLREEFSLFYSQITHACIGLGATNGLVCLCMSTPLFSAFARRVKLFRCAINTPLGTGFIR